MKTAWIIWAGTEYCPIVYKIVYNKMDLYKYKNYVIEEIDI